MAVKATNQVDIVDLTDGYSVVMSSEAVSLVGGTTYANAATATTTIYTLNPANSLPNHGVKKPTSFPNIQSSDLTK